MLGTPPFLAGLSGVILPLTQHFLLGLPRTAQKMQVVSLVIKNTFLNTVFQRSSFCSKPVLGLGPLQLF